MSLRWVQMCQTIPWVDMVGYDGRKGLRRTNRSTKHTTDSLAYVIPPSMIGVLEDEY